MAKTVDNVVVSGLYRQYGPFLRARILSQTGCAAAADDMFRILMGEKVEPRREFIEKHALEVRNLDV